MFSVFGIGIPICQQPTATKASPVTEISPRSLESTEAHGVNYFSNLRKQMHLIILTDQLQKTKDL